MGYDLKLRVWRGDVSGGDLRDYTVEAQEGEVVLDAIHRLQATQVGDLAVRWNCKAGKCGSCSAEINGKPRLLCMTRLSDFEESDTITVTPMRSFPVIRDLVTDVSYNYEKAKDVPAFAPTPRDADGKRRMMQEDVERSQEFRKCIECFLCQDVCHVIRDHEGSKKAYAGPRFFLRYAELDMHPLDTNDRRKLTQDAAGLGMCNITKCCTEVCPENIKITDNAIIPMKERVADRKYDPVVWLGSKIFRRGDYADREEVRRGRRIVNLLTEDEIKLALSDELKGWTRKGEAITRSVTADSFVDGIRLVSAVAEVAEDRNHHPDIDIRWTTITFTLSTHSEGGLTANDVRLAADIDRLAT